MRCDRCGLEASGDARFCAGCGAPLGGRGTVEPGFYPPPPDPDRRRRRNLWWALTAVIAVLIGVAVAVPFVLAARGDEQPPVISTSTSTSAHPTTTARPTSTTTPAPSSTTSTSAPSIPGLPGDSDGTWVEADIPMLPGQPLGVALSDEVMLLQVEAEGGYRLLAHYLASGGTYQLPVGTGDVGGIDVESDTAIWWEGTYDAATAGYIDQHIYAYQLPDGPKIDVVKDAANVGYPQIAGRWLTWVEGSPWEENPDEYWRMPIFGALLDSQGRPVDTPTRLVPSAVASILGDSGWTYSLSATFLAWEQATEIEGATTGTHVVDIGTLEMQSLGPDAWRPSLSEDKLVYWENGLAMLDLTSGESSALDPRGDFATAAPTFTAYYRPIDPPDGGYEIVARGYEGRYEQVLAGQADAPWLSPTIAASSSRVAFIAGGVLHVFEWEAR